MLRVNAMSTLQTLLAFLVVQFVAGQVPQAKPTKAKKVVANSSGLNSSGCQEKRKLDLILGHINKALGVPNITIPPLPPLVLPAVTPAPDPCRPVFDCQMKADWLDSWSTEQILWCCKHKAKGCFQNPRVQQERESTAWKAKLQMKKLAGQDTILLNQLKAAKALEKSLDARKVKALKEQCTANKVAAKQAEMMARAVNDSRKLKPHDDASLLSEFSSRLKEVQRQKGRIQKKLDTVKKKEETVHKMQLNASARSDKMKKLQNGLKETKSGVKEREGKLYVKQVAFKEILHHQQSLLSIERRSTKRANQELTDAMAALQASKKHHGAQHSTVSKRVNAFTTLKKKIKGQTEALMQHDASLKEYISTERRKLQRRKQSVIANENGIVQEELGLDDDLAKLGVKQASLKRKIFRLVNKQSKTSSKESESSSIFDHLISPGTKLVATKTTPIWSATENFTTIGQLRRGDEVVAADIPSIVPKSHLHVAVPIKPKGFIRLDALVKKSLLVKTEKLTATQRAQQESGIMKGTPLVNTMASPVWQDKSRSVLVGKKEILDKSIAVGPPVSSKHGSTLMVPVKPRGFINLAHVAVDHSTLRKMKQGKKKGKKGEGNSTATK